MKHKERWKVYGNVFSEHSKRVLFKLSSQGYFEELESAISVGKEANVFTAKNKYDERIIVKIYRLENCNFKKMGDYLNSDPRYSGVINNKRQIVFTWTQREYRNLLLARQYIKVPTPIAFKDNILLMEFIGDNDPAPELKDTNLKDPKRFLDDVFENIKILYKNGIIHGDLSQFNILNYKDKPVFIDFSQATVKESENAQLLLKRDIENILIYFNKKYNIKLDFDVVYRKIISQKSNRKNKSLIS
ncbi:MAG: serine protein kinase RIO [Candidatus Woesearchaeota archaeon]